MALTSGPGRSTSDFTNYLAFAVQSAKDVAGTTFYFTKHLSGSGFDVETDTAAERIGGGGKQVGLVYKTAVKADGSIVTYGWIDGFARLLSAALGEDELGTAVFASSAGATPALVPHTLSTGSPTLPYLTIRQQWADEVEQVTNAVMSSLKIEGEAGKPVKLTSQFISGGTPQVLTTATTAAVPREAGLPLMVPGASALLTVFGGAGSPFETAELTKWSIEIKNALDDAIRTLSLFREDVVWNMLDINFDATIKYVNAELWKQIEFGGGTQVPVAVPTASFEFFSAQQPVPSLSADLKMPFIALGNGKVNKLDPDGKTMYVDVTGYTFVTATDAISARLITGATGLYTSPTT